MGIALREFARQLGVSPNAIRKAIRAGRVTREDDGTIDPEKGALEWHRTRELRVNGSAPRPPGGLPPPPGMGGDMEPGEGPEAPGGDQARAAATRGYQTSRAVREAYLARLAKLEFEERQGQLVSAAEVKVAAFNTARRARDLLLAMPDRVSSVLAATEDPHEVKRVLNLELRRICEELSDGSRLGRADLA